MRLDRADPDAYAAVTHHVSSSTFVDIWNEVPLVPQLTGMSCWAAAAAMLVGWRDAVVVDPEQVASATGRWEDYRDGLRPTDVDSLARSWRLVVVPQGPLTLRGLTQLLERYGPLWMGEASPGLHSLVVTGLHGDGTEDGTFVRINDPWPVGRGERYQLPFPQLVRGFRAATDAVGTHAQLLHSGGRRLGLQRNIEIKKCASSTLVTSDGAKEKDMHSIHHPRPRGNGHSHPRAFGTVPAQETYLSSAQLAVDPLFGHGGTGENVFLRWNAVAGALEAIDVVVHLHGYSPHAPSRPMFEEVVAKSGLDLSGRSRPTLGVIVRGKKITPEEMAAESAAGGSPNPNRYTFGGLTSEGGLGLEQLLGQLLEWWGRTYLGREARRVIPVDRLIFTAHSGGGAALNKLLRQHGVRRVCNPDEVFVFDAVYGAPGQQGDGIAAWAKQRIAAETAGGAPGALRIVHTSETTPGSAWVIGQVGPQTPQTEPRYRAEPVTTTHDEVATTYGRALLADASTNIVATDGADKLGRVAYGTPMGLFSAYRTRHDGGDFDPDGYDMAQPQSAEAIGVGWAIAESLVKSSGSVTYDLKKMEGHKTPWDQKKKYPIKNVDHRTQTAKCYRHTRLNADEIGAQFTIKYETDGHSVGNIEILPERMEGSWLGWDLHVAVSMMPDTTAYRNKKTGARPLAAVRVTLTYRFTHRFHDDHIFREVFQLYGDGTRDLSRKWVQG